MINSEKLVENLKVESNQGGSYHETTEFMIQRKERDERSRITTVGFKKANFNKLKELVHEVLGRNSKAKRSLGELRVSKKRFLKQAIF